MQDLKGRVAVITGGGSGIGAAIARALAREGMRLVLADVETDAMETVAATIDGEVLQVRTDVSKIEDVMHLAERAFSTFGGAHVVCNNAGVARFGSIETITHRDWQWLINVNLWGVIHGVEAFVPRLIAQRQPAHIVNTASMAGLAGMQGLSAYTATKFAVVGLSEALQRDLRPHGIGVSVLCPMIVSTNINASERNRPPELRDPGWERPSADFSPPPPDGMVGGVIGAEEVAARVVAGIKNDELYIITHAASREILRRRCERLDQAATKA